MCLYVRVNEKYIEVEYMLDYWLHMYVWEVVVLVVLVVRMWQTGKTHTKMNKQKDLLTTFVAILNVLFFWNMDWQFLS